MFEKAQFPALSHVYICPHVSGKLLHFLDTVQRFPSGQHLAQTVQHVVAFWKCSAARKPNVTGPITSLLRDQGKSVSAPSELHVPLFFYVTDTFSRCFGFFFFCSNLSTVPTRPLPSCVESFQQRPGNVRAAELWYLQVGTYRFLSWPCGGIT